MQPKPITYGSYTRKGGRATFWGTGILVKIPPINRNIVAIKDTLISHR